MCVGVDERLARHIGHLWIRDPLVIFQGHVDVDDTKTSEHFEVSHGFRLSRTHRSLNLQYVDLFRVSASAAVPFFAGYYGSYMWFLIIVPVLFS